MEIQGKTLAERIKFARHLLEMTQEELAEQAQIPLRTLQGIEYETSKSPGVDNIFKIARAMKLPIGDLLEPKQDLPDFNLASRVLSQIGALSPNSQRTILAFVLDDDSYIAEHPERAKLLRLLQEFRKLR